MSNVIQYLDSNKITYHHHVYSHDENIRKYAEEAVEKLWISAERVYKTLVFSGGDFFCLAVISSTDSVSTKKLSKLCNSKKVSLANSEDTIRITWYSFGWVSPILVWKKQVKTFVDKKSLSQETIFVSAGKKWEEIELSPRDLCELLGAELEDVVC